MTHRLSRVEAVAIGASAGGLDALTQVLSPLPAHFPAAIAVVQHISADSGDRLSHILDARCRLAVSQAEDKEPLRPGRVYVAPADYHLLVEEDRTFSLAVDERVSFARPSVDVLFESAAEAYCSALVGVILTGAGRDGASGLSRIVNLGGRAVVQDLDTAEVPSMPAAALQAVPEAQSVPLEQIGPLLVQLCESSF